MPPPNRQSIIHTKQANWLHLILFLLLAVSTVLIVLKVPNLYSDKLFFLRIIMGLSTAGIAAIIPGFFEINIKWLDNTIRSGGAIGLFILVFTYTPPAIIPNNSCISAIDLNGDWSIETVSSIGAKTIGVANIQQNNMECFLKIYGDFENLTEGKPKIRFNSEIAEIKDNEIIFVYMNNDDERGVCRGQLNVSNPDEI